MTYLTIFGIVLENALYVMGDSRCFESNVLRRMMGVRLGMQ